jgi:hypothetical protein
MGFIPCRKPSRFGHVFALVYLHVAHIAQGRNPVVMGFDAHPLAIALLI